RRAPSRNRLSLAKEPSRMNNYTAMMAIDDPQGGGDNYAFEGSWQAETDVAEAPAPFFDDVRACQDTVRARFQSQNGRGSYIDFHGFADRFGQGQGQYQNQSQDQGQGRYQGQSRNRGQESIQGHGSARRSNEYR